MGKPTAYIVYGETGEYDDYTSWNVRAFITLKEAQEFAERLNSVLKRLGAFNDGNKNVDWLNHDMVEAMEREIAPLDKRYSLDYTGSEYKVDTIPMGQI